MIKISRYLTLWTTNVNKWRSSKKPGDHQSHLDSFFGDHTWNVPMSWDNTAPNSSWWSTIIQTSFMCPLFINLPHLFLPELAMPFVSYDAYQRELKRVFCILRDSGWLLSRFTNLFCGCSSLLIVIDWFISCDGDCKITHQNQGQGLSLRFFPLLSI